MWPLFGALWAIYWLCAAARSKRRYAWWGPGASKRAPEVHRTPKYRSLGPTNLKTHTLHRALSSGRSYTWQSSPPQHATRKPSAQLARRQEDQRVAGAADACRPAHTMEVLLIPAVLKAKIKFYINFPSGFGPKSAPNHRFPSENDSPDPPPDPPGGGGTRNN